MGNTARMGHAGEVRYYRKEIICLFYFIGASIAFRVWIIVIDAHNTLFEVVAGVVTAIIFAVILWRIRRGCLDQQPQRDAAAEVATPRLVLLRYAMDGSALLEQLTEDMVARLPRSVFRGGRAYPSG
eukprot:gene42139-51454_t